jgi:hypothetical protein
MIFVLSYFLRLVFIRFPKQFGSSRLQKAKRTKNSAARTSPPRRHSPSALEDCVMRVKGGSGGGAGGAGGLPSPYVKWERVRVSLSTRPFLPRAREGGR